MKLYPAIDLRDGHCVRLYQGDYDQQTTYGDDPVAQALAFTAEGAEIVHVVDLDAARTGEPTNRPVIAAVCAALDVPVQVGGGVRSVEAAEALFELGVDRVVIGTAAIENPDLVARLAGRGHSVVVGLDARGDRVATHGWTTDSGETVTDLARRFESVGVHSLVVTEISRDGTLSGPDVDGLSSLLAETATPVIASGGVGNLEHLRTLASVSVPVPVPAPDEGAAATGRAVDGGEPAIRRLAGAIVGRALYESKFTVSEALVAAREITT